MKTQQLSKYVVGKDGKLIYQIDVTADVIGGLVFKQVCGVSKNHQFKTTLVYNYIGPREPSTTKESCVLWFETHYK